MTGTSCAQAFPAQRTLVVDSATEACSVALLDEDGTLLAGDWRMLGRGHAESLVPMIAALPDNGRADRIAVALGPGSFTGVRVGLAAARALALAWHADIVGYSTLDMIAAMAAAERPGLPLAVAMTGGHGEWFVQTYDADSAIDMPLSSLHPEQAVETCPQSLIAGSQAQALLARRVPATGGEALVLWPDARRFALLSPMALTMDVTPIYGRAPDALLPGGIKPASAA
ncbi:tRNA (adenosine(37)-N6)-threonylcarbamoyltransferase complex dimerization subunit type 1 TsaB [Novosphingobium sp. 9]|uniref:tRNA (adenosine(37)-N6)-threonylcarbamoyltransferase complex dimerization subunit type 1 TsaB n=1 Tax=Novosphingobium sp. 9 TaxID=2025349 RepID=UPI0021B5C8BF|nr:tRNA (adenosine(37)-N6)-threonylcarbamoyltransferase complex dimerization subunit type 1 TsaB [Novosphingobium sp. 9]